MGKENRRKAHQQKEASFPFRLLNYWIKPYRGDEQRCRCGNEASYLFEHYMNDFEAQRLLASGKSEAETTDIVWNQALQAQRQGKYTRHGITAHCETCTFKILTISVGENAATLAMMPMLVTGGQRGSVILANELQTQEDPGKPFTSFTNVQTIEDLAVQLRSEGVPIHLKKRNNDE